MTEISTVRPRAARRRSPARTLALALTLALAAAAGVVTAAATPAQATGCARTWPMDKIFHPNEYYYGCNGELFIYQSDGNVVLYGADGTPRWSTGAFAPNGMLMLQADGNLVQYDSTAGTHAVWASNTFTSSAYLGFGHDGNLVVMDNTGADRPIWWSNQNDCRPYEWATGKVFRPGEYYVNCSGDMLIMQAWDGNVVQFSNGQPVWATNVAAPNGRMEFQAHDGNLVVYNSANQPVWAANTPNPGGTMTFTPYGELALLTAQQKPSWVEAEKKKNQLVNDINQRLDKLEQERAAGKVDPDTYDDYKGHLLRVKTALTGWTPGAPGPCDSWKSIAFAALGLSAGTAGLISKAGAKEMLVKFASIATLLKSIYELYQLFDKCSTFEELRQEWRNYEEPLELDPNYRKTSLLVPFPFVDGTDVEWTSWGFSEAPDGEVTAVMSDAIVEGHPEWQVNFTEDPQTPANTVIQAVEQDGGTLYTMQDGSTLFMPLGENELGEFFDPGDGTQVLYDEFGNWVMALGDNGEILNINDSWDEPSAYDFDYGYGGYDAGWAWGCGGFGGWSDAGGGGDGAGGGGGGGDYDYFAWWEMSEV